MIVCENECERKHGSKKKQAETKEGAKAAHFHAC